MALLREATNEQAAAKVGEFGEPGSGKTTTAALLAIGISKTYCNNAPVAMMDTERASDFVIPIFRAEGVALLTHKSKAFADMMTVLSEAEKSGCCCLIIDSVTHTWDELIDSYCKKRNIAKPEFHHWRDIKGPWKLWTDRYLTSALHIIVVGRVGYEYEYQVNAENGKKELIKGDSKMRTEGQFGYEPHLLLEFQRERDGNRFNHVANVLKDRSWALNGKTLTFTDQPTYKVGYYKIVFDAFKPHFDLLAIGGQQQQLNEANSAALFPGGHSEHYQREQEKRIALDEILATMQLLWPGQSAAEKQTRIRILETLWGVRAWSAVEAMPLEDVQRGLRALRDFEKQKEPAVDPDGMLALLEKSVREAKPPAAGPANGDPWVVPVSEKPAAPAQTPIDLPPVPPSKPELHDDELDEIVITDLGNGYVRVSGATLRIKSNLKNVYGGEFDRNRRSWVIAARYLDPLKKVCQELGMPVVETAEANV